MALKEMKAGLGLIIFIITLTSLTWGLPVKNDEIEEEEEGGGGSNVLNYASEASQIIAINLLKSYNDIDGNQVHSPLGITTMLAILAEAARGDSYEEFSKVLHYPMDRSALRESFKNILSNYQGRVYGVEPSFQTWLYIYRNFTAHEDFKLLMQNYYYVDVKDINQNDYGWFDSTSSLDFDTFPNTTTSNSKDVIGFETLKRLKYDDSVRINDIQHRDNHSEEEKTLTTVNSITDGYGDEIIEKETSKFDRYLDDQQYVEKPQIIKEEHALVATTEEDINKKPESKGKLEDVDEKPVVVNDGVVSSSLDTIESSFEDQSKREDDLNLEENETVQEQEKIFKNLNANKKAEQLSEKLLVPIQDVLDSNEPEKVSLPLEKLAAVLDEASKTSATDAMTSLETHVCTARNVLSGRSLFQNDDITSALSANAITGRETGSKTKMLLFNGLYYRGRWSTPFIHESENDEFFYMTAEDATKVTMMHTKGKFHMAEVKRLSAKVLCLPYENKKYTMMIILPNELEGLHSLIKQITPNDLKQMKSLMKEQNLHIVLPKFQFEETSRSESMLKGLGLTKIFSRHEANLSLLSDDQDIHVDEIVQFVNIRVDEAGNSQAAISATDTQGRNGNGDEHYELIAMDHPFLYFVMDCENNFILVSGKVHAPELQAELPVSIEIEFQQA
uniref:Serpin domain-containing protein n=1 Tax=Glossina brevipalpis TaxID=37001 RepID=A0A1A9W6K7_9MUSC